MIAPATEDFRDRSRVRLPIGEDMRIHARFNGGLIEIFGGARLTVSLPEGATLSELVHCLREHHPGASSGLGSALLILHGQHISPDEPLAEGQEVAFLLPVAGG